MQPRLTTLTLNGRDSIEESVPRARSICYDQQSPAKSKSPYHDSYKYRRDYYGDNKNFSFNKYNGTKLKDTWSNHSTLKQANKFSQPYEEKYASIDSSKKYQRYKTARPKPLQYENHKYYDLVFPKKKDNNSTDIFYRSNYYLEYAEL